MAPLPPIAQPEPTLEAADRALEARALNEPRRTYLGMSALGEPCGRKLWYGLRGAHREAFDAATLKRFADGHASEDTMAKRLRMVDGITLLTIDPDTGKQFSLQDFDGRLQGHMDGVIHGILEAPKTWHVWEGKCVAEKGFNDFVKLRDQHGSKSTLAIWNPIYWAQGQLYMGYARLTRHFLTVCTPGARNWASCRTEFEPSAFEALKGKAERILNAYAPLARVSNDPAWWQCRMCGHAAVCHGNAAA